MSSLKKTILICVLILSTVLFVGGYFGFIPFISDITDANKPRDLGMGSFHESVKLLPVDNGAIDIKSMIASGEKIQIEEVTQKQIDTINSKTPDKKPMVQKTSLSVSASLTSEEVLSLLQKWNTEESPIEKGFQMRINSDNTAEISGLLNKAKLSTVLSQVKINGISGYVKLLAFMPEQLPFYLKGNVSVENNNIELVPVKLEIGRMSLPFGKGRVNSVEKWIENKISGMQIESLNFSEGKMNVKGIFPSKLFL